MKNLFCFFVLIIFLWGCTKKTDATIITASITSISPTSGSPNTLVTIKGSHFGTNMLGDSVKFNGILATVQSVTDTTITALVPVSAGTGIITVNTSNGNLSGPVFTYLPDVFVCGYESNGTNNIAKYWKNGTAVSLSGSSSYATGITIVGNDVYVSGTNNYDSNYYWKNGNVIVLNGPNSGYLGISIKGIAVLGTDVYVVGNDNAINNNGKALYWKNGGTNINLPYSSNYIFNGNTLSGAYSQVSAIAVSGTDFYIFGCTGYKYISGSSAGRQVFTNNYIPTYWKNGTALLVDTSKPANVSYTSISAYNTIMHEITGIVIVNSDIYSSGNLFGSPQLAKYWKNGTSIALTDGTKNSGTSGIIAIGTDVYVSGFESNGTNNVAKYWKNGIAVALTDGTKNAGTTGITAFGNDIYISGFEGGVVKYWKNGIAVALTDGSKNASASGISVR